MFCRNKFSLHSIKCYDKVYIAFSGSPSKNLNFNKLNDDLVTSKLTNQYFYQQHVVKVD
jgi:hypothetical protein